MADLDGLMDGLMHYYIEAEYYPSLGVVVLHLGVHVDVQLTQQQCLKQPTHRERCNIIPLPKQHHEKYDEQS